MFWNFLDVFYFTKTFKFSCEYYELEFSTIKCSLRMAIVQPINELIWALLARFLSSGMPLRFLLDPYNVKFQNYIKSVQRSGNITHEFMMFYKSLRQEMPLNKHWDINLNGIPTWEDKNLASKAQINLLIGRTIAIPEPLFTVENSN